MSEIPFSPKSDQRFTALIEELQAWPGPQISSHKSANQFFHKLVFLADTGCTLETPGIQSIVDAILNDVDENGIPCLFMNIPKAFGGSGTDSKAWVLCDAPNTLYALVKFGLQGEQGEYINMAVDYLAGLIGEHGRGSKDSRSSRSSRSSDMGGGGTAYVSLASSSAVSAAAGPEYGFGCTASKVLGSWHGPGKKSDPCPYATLVMAKLLLQFGDRYLDELSSCAECLLGLWEESRTRHPYIFYMGTDFRKLKLPFIWYDILHVLEVLSQIEAFRSDPRLLKMYAAVTDKRNLDADGYIPESVYMPWKGWDFGQKKKRSEWMTYCVERIGSRLENRVGV